MVPVGLRLCISSNYTDGFKGLSTLPYNYLCAPGSAFLRWRLL